MDNLSLGFIGAGNMAGSLIRGLIADGVNPASLVVADIDDGKLAALSSECGVRTGSNQSIAETAEVIVLAVKPQVMQAVCGGITLGERSPLLVSVAAGITIGHLENWLGADTAIVRCMPNTPALIGKGASGLFANSNTSGQQRDLATRLMQAVGLSIWVETEDAMDTVTALSGSGPAYFFLFLEAMQDAAVELGLSKDVANQLSIQTALGASELALQSEDSVAGLRKKVTSPGGTTERAIHAFEAGGLRNLVAQSIKAAQQRSRELAKDSDGS